MATASHPYNKTSAIYNDRSNLTTLDQARSAQATCIDVLKELQEDDSLPRRGMCEANENHIATVYGIALEIFIQKGDLLDSNKALREYSRYIDKRVERPGNLARFTKTLATAYLDHFQPLNAVQVLITHPHYLSTGIVKEVAEACLLHNELNAADTLLRKHPFQNEPTRNQLAHRFIQTGHIDDAERLLKDGVEHSSDIWERIVQAHIANKNLALAERAAVKSEKDDLILLVCKTYMEQGLPLEARTLATTSRLKDKVELLTAQLPSLSIT